MTLKERKVLRHQFCKPFKSNHFNWLTRTHSRREAIANRHAKIFSVTLSTAQATELKFRSICFLSFICEIYSHKVWYKNLWNWLIDIWPHPKVTSLTQGWKFYLHSVLLIIPVSLICHMTMFEKKNFFDPWASPGPPSPTPGAWPRWQNKNPVRYILFVRTHTKFGIKIFETEI